jgi:hypothetical protein
MRPRRSTNLQNLAYGNAILTTFALLRDGKLGEESSQLLPQCSRLVDL